MYFTIANILMASHSVQHMLGAYQTTAADIPLLLSVRGDALCMNDHASVS